MVVAAPGPYPEPPDDLDRRRLPLRVVPDPVWYRGHRKTHAPLHFNRGRGRFGPPDGVAFGTLYLGEDEYAAFIEAFSQGIESTPLGLFASESLLRQSCLCIVRSRRPVRLVDLTTGAALKQLAASADSRIGDGPHSLSQRWAAAFWNHPERPDGLLYRSRNAPDHLAVALFDRAADALTADCGTNLLTDRHRLGRLLDHFGCALIP